jgi:D-tagatose-1,6-bisphosphate aldolase subunit GatZ/KbaZ
LKAVLERVQRHKLGQAVGLTSVCSAHPVVIEAALRESAARGEFALIEATSNQVNPFGGYTGMRPADFRDHVFGIAARAGIDRSQVLLGGDHLGPNAWQREPAEVAMAHAELMVTQYVEAGFRKIHLDCSMSCAGDPAPLPETLVAERAAHLATACESAWARVGGEPPVYVVGTEVPVPGGAHETLAELAVTRAGDAGQTIALHERAFVARGLGEAWSRVVALVVQPGVEFDHHRVIDYVPTKARNLSAFIAAQPGLVYEAHSTDYQTPAALGALVHDHFAILKVGPGASFALREALWALADVAAQSLGDEAVPLKRVVLDAMRAEPSHWRHHYTNRGTLDFDLAYSLSDRIRYYWARPEVAAACDALVAQLEQTPPPLTLLSQYLPAQYRALREGRISADPQALLRDAVGVVLRPYLDACAPASA